MKIILKEFYKANAKNLVLYTLICAAIIGAFFLTGIFAKEKTLAAGVLASAFIALSDLIMLVQVFVIAPRKLRSQLDKLAPEQRAAVTEGFAETQPISGCYFTRDLAVVFSYRRIYLLQYTRIISAEPGKNNLFLTLISGKTVIIEFGFGADIDRVLAAFTHKNPHIRLINADKGKEA